MPYRPANINKLPPEAAHVINQSIRETNFRIDDLTKQLNGRHIFLLPITTRQGIIYPSGSRLNNAISGLQALNFGTVNAQSSSVVTINIPNATTNAAAFASPAADLGNSNLTWSAWVKQAGVVEVRLSNPTTGNITPSIVAWRVWVHQ